jgi:hypothetical protein
MKNAVFWDIRTQLVPHRRHITAVTMKNAVFGMLRRVSLVRTDVSEECSASIIRVTRIGELGTA